ncbi:MAG: SprT-like domain-containing protein [Verrucomicrobiota bacterium]
MPLFEQLDLRLAAAPIFVVLGRDLSLEARAREIFRALHADDLAREVRVEWNARLFSAAGRADCARTLISLNPRLHEHGASEIDRTLRHELAHLLAQFRGGRRRVAPHGAQWRQACRDLGIGDETRCHALPFPVQRRSRRYIYECPRCQNAFPRVRLIKRPVACLECCRKFNRGKFDKGAQLRLVSDKS